MNLKFISFFNTNSNSSYIFRTLFTEGTDSDITIKGMFKIKNVINGYFLSRKGFEVVKYHVLNWFRRYNFGSDIYFESGPKVQNIK